MAEAKRDKNHIPSVLGVSNADGVTPIPIYVDSVTNRLLVSGSAGTEYTEGDIDATITGQAMLWEDAADTLRAVSSAKPLPVNIISGASSGTEYTEDVAAAADPVGTMNIAVRADTLAAVTNADGDNIALRATNKGEMYVKQTDAVPVTDNGGSLTVDVGTALPAGTNNIGDVDVLTLPAGTVAGSSSLPAGTNNIGDVDVLTLPATTNAGATAKTSDYDTGAGTDTVTMMGVALPASGGAVQGGTSTNPIRTDPTGTTTQPVSGTVSVNALPAGTNNIGDVDVLTINGQAPAFGSGVRSASTQRVTIATDDVVPASQSGTWTVQPGNTANTTAWLVDARGNVAHDAADSGNPVKVGGKVETSLATVTTAADGDRSDFHTDADGAQLVRLNFPLGDLKTDATSNTDGASTASTVFTAVASTRNVITAINVFRNDAGTTPIYIDFRDGTAGAVLWRMVMPPNGGSIITDPTGIFRTTANTALAYDVSAATTTVYINVSGFQSKV